MYWNFPFQKFNSVSSPEKISNVKKLQKKPGFIWGLRHSGVSLLTQRLYVRIFPFLWMSQLSLCLSFLSREVPVTSVVFFKRRIPSYECQTSNSFRHYCKIANGMEASCSTFVPFTDSLSIVLISSLD